MQAMRCVSAYDRNRLEITKWLYRIKQFKYLEYGSILALLRKNILRMRLARVSQPQKL